MILNLLILGLLSVPVHPETSVRDADVLLVDDDGGTNDEGHLIEGLIHNSYAYDLWSVVDSGRGPTASEMYAYGAVIWNTGDENEETLTASDTFNIGGYLIALSGKLWLIGQDILYDFEHSHTPPWSYPSWMNVLSHGEDVGADSAIGVAGDPVASGLRLGLSAGYVADHADTVRPVSSSYAAMWRKVGSSLGGANAIRVQGIAGRTGFKLFFQVFPFENLDALSDTLVRRVLTWFGYPPPTYTLDASVLSIDEPGAMLEPGATYVPKVTVKNRGSIPQHFWTVLSIDSSGVGVYRDSVNTPQISPGATYQASFDGFEATSERAGASYVLTAWVRLGSDEYPDNDTLRALSTVRIIESGLASAAPVLDGVLSSGEWSDAVLVDISDRLGAVDAPNVPRSCRLYLMNDYASLYMAFDLPLDSFPANGDQVMFRFDEDGDGAWASDSSEGSHFVVAGILENHSMFVAEPSGFMLYDPETPRFDVSLVPHRVFEIAMDFGSETWELSAHPGSIIGLLCLAVSRSTSFPDDVAGLWPTSVPSPDWTSPGSFGDLLLAYVCGDVNGDGFVDAEDVGALGEYLVGEGPAPVPLRSGDANGDGLVTVSDAAYLVSYLYFGGPEPVCP